MKTKETYKEWIEYCTLAADDIQDIDQAHDSAAGSMWLNFGRKWELVYAVREWEPELFDECSGELGKTSDLDDLMEEAAFVLTRAKIEEKFQAKKALDRYDWDVNRYGDVTLYKYTGDKCRDIYIQGDDAEQLEAELENCDTQELLNMVISEYFDCIEEVEA